MFSNLTTKIALKKMGLSADTFSLPEPEPKPKPKAKSKKQAKDAPSGSVPGLDEEEGVDASGWPAWMSVRSLPLTMQPWLSPPPPPIPVAECPKMGDAAPLDRDRKLTFGGGKAVMVVFLRCVGCAFAQKTFLTLRALATRHNGTLTCIAVSHSSAAATQKWIDMLGGAWSVGVVVDEDRAVYAAWGLGLGSVWYVLNPQTQAQAWREKGWLASSVAGAIQRTGLNGRGQSALDGDDSPRPRPASVPVGGNGAGVVGSDLDGPGTVLGNKWQEAGAWAVDGRGRVVWGGKALRADDVMDLDAGIAAVGL